MRAVEVRAATAAPLTPAIASDLVATALGADPHARWNTFDTMKNRMNRYSAASISRSEKSVARCGRRVRVDEPGATGTGSASAGIQAPSCKHCA